MAFLFFLRCPHILGKPTERECPVPYLIGTGLGDTNYKIPRFLVFFLVTRSFVSRTVL